MSAHAFPPHLLLRATQHLAPRLLPQMGLVATDSLVFPSPALFVFPSPSLSLSFFPSCFFLCSSFLYLACMMAAGGHKAVKFFLCKSFLLCLCFSGRLCRKLQKRTEQIKHTSSQNLLLRRSGHTYANLKTKRSSQNQFSCCRSDVFLTVRGMAPLH